MVILLGENSKNMCIRIIEKNQDKYVNKKTWMEMDGWRHYVWSTHQHVNPTIIFSSTHLFEWSQLLMNRSNITWTCFSENQSFNTIVLFKTLNKNYNTLNLSQWWLNDDTQLVCVSLSKVNRTKQSRLNDNL